MSKPSKKTLAYYFRNFFHIVPFVVVPALLLGYARSSDVTAKFFVDLANGNLASADTFRAIMRTFTVVRYFGSWWIVLLGLLSTVFAVNVLIYKIDRHMHLGLMSNKNLFKVAFSNYLVTLLFVLMLVFIAELLNLLIAGLMYFIAPYLSGVPLSILIAVLVFACDIFIAYLIAVLICTLPAIHSERFALNVAMSYSIRLMSKQWRAILSTIVYYVVSKALIVILAYFVHNIYALTAINFVYYFMWIGMLPCFACRTYIRVNNDERHDIYPIKQFNQR